MTEAASPSGPPPPETIGLMVETAPGPGVLHELTGVMARHHADITLVEILESGPAKSRIYFETTVPSSAETLEKDLAALPIARRVTVVKTFQRIYGKRIIIVGGGAQVQVLVPSGRLPDILAALAADGTLDVVPVPGSGS